MTEEKIKNYSDKLTIISGIIFIIVSFLPNQMITNFFRYTYSLPSITPWVINLIMVLIFLRGLGKSIVPNFGQIYPSYLMNLATSFHAAIIMMLLPLISIIIAFWLDSSREILFRNFWITYGGLGLLFIVFFKRDYVTYKILKRTPTSKVRSAAMGLNELSVNIKGNSGWEIKGDKIIGFDIYSKFKKPASDRVYEESFEFFDKTYVQDNTGELELRHGRYMRRNSLGFALDMNPNVLEFLENTSMKKEDFFKKFPKDNFSEKEIKKINKVLELNSKEDVSIKYYKEVKTILFANLKRDETGPYFELYPKVNTGITDHDFQEEYSKRKALRSLQIATYMTLLSLKFLIPILS